MSLERATLDRLEGLGLRAYVTGSWALAAYLRLYPELEGPRLESIIDRLEREWRAGTWTGFRRSL